ncbi:MAG: hypothetical protein II164_04395 [Firmicutes bacterium]|nr:hypothetical protein [Bacillota bacterium]
MKKLFGGIDLTWKKLIIFAVIAGIYTGVMAALPITKDTSFADISITFEWWVLFGIIIIVNSKTPLDSALKCFVFFLISQPLVYLVQVPFNAYGWGIFRYYPGWFVWTLCTIPMGFIGHSMKKEKWWSLVILVPMLAFVGYHYYGFLGEAVSFFPSHLLSAVFCAATMIIYPLYIFREKWLRLAGVIISVVIIAAASVLSISAGRSWYNTTILVENGSMEVSFDDSYTVSLEDESYGNVYIVYEKNIESYMVNAEFKKTGNTRLILRAPDGTAQYFDLKIERSSYEIKKSSE